MKIENGINFVSTSIKQEASYQTNFPLNLFVQNTSFNDYYRLKGSVPVYKEELEEISWPSEDFLEDFHKSSKKNVIWFEIE